MLDSRLLGEQGIKEEFDIEVALLMLRIEQDKLVALHRRLDIEGIGRRCAHPLLGEIKFVGNIEDRLVDQYLVAIEDGDMVEKKGDVVDLMGGDDNGLLIGHTRCNDLAELALGGDVEAIGGLVHHEQAGVGGEGEADEGFLLLPHRELAQTDIVVKVELTQAGFQNLIAEVGIEGAVELDVLLEIDAREGKFLGHQIGVAEQLDGTALHIVAVDMNIAALGTQESTQEIKQCRLAGTVLAQQTDNLSTFERQ